MKNPLEGKLTISRPSYGDGKRVIRITLNDQLSGTEALEIQIGYEEFTEALTGHSFMPCQFEMHSGVVGKRREIKTEQIRLPKELGYSLTNEQLQALLEPYEVDGWQGRASDLTNQHRASRDDCHLRNVTFIRFVNPD